VLVEETAAVATTSATAVIKNASNRERPDGSDNEGLALGSQFKSICLPHDGCHEYRCPARASAGANWLALEFNGHGDSHGLGESRGRGVHCPSDVLFGAALGNCLGHCLQQAFLGQQDNRQVHLYMDADSGFSSQPGAAIKI
jgi:hypothetical protein